MIWVLLYLYKKNVVLCHDYLSCDPTIINSYINCNEVNCSMTVFVRFFPITSIDALFCQQYQKNDYCMSLITAVDVIMNLVHCKCLCDTVEK